MKAKGKKRDFFWVLMVSGVIAVSALAWFLGKWGGTMLTNRQGGQARQSEFGPGGAAGDGLSEEERAARIGRVEGMGEPDVSGHGGEAGSRESSEEQAENAAETEATEGAAETGAGEENAEDSLLVDDSEATRAPATATAGGSEPAAPDAPPAETAGPLYRLQVGIFTRKENALLVKNDLEQNYQMPVVIVEVNLDGEVKYRVQAGAFRNRENAEKMARELRVKGHHAYIWKDEQ